MRQVVGVVLSQASTVVLAALVVAVPAGIIGGRVAWLLTARWLGIPAHPVVPAGLVLGVAIAALLVSNLVALWPGVRAGRARAAVALRTE